MSLDSKAAELARRAAERDLTENVMTAVAKAREDNLAAPAPTARDLFAMQAEQQMLPWLVATHPSVWVQDATGRLRRVLRADRVHTNNRDETQLVIEGGHTLALYGLHPTVFIEGAKSDG